MSLTYDEISSSGRRDYPQQNQSDSSMKTDTTWRYSVFGQDRLGKGAMLFTGPDGIRDHRQRVEPEQRYVGEGTMSPEGSSETSYLWRSFSGAPHPRPKSKTVGEVGWGVPEYSHLFSSGNTGAQIKLGEFRQATEDRHTHLYLNPWFPGQKEKKCGDAGESLTEGNIATVNPVSPPASPVEAQTSQNQVRLSSASSPNNTGINDVAVVEQETDNDT